MCRLGLQFSVLLPRRGKLFFFKDYLLIPFIPFIPLILNPFVEAGD